MTTSRVSVTAPRLGVIAPMHAPVSFRRRLGTLRLPLCAGGQRREDGAGLELVWFQPSLGPVIQRFDSSRRSLEFPPVTVKVELDVASRQTFVRLASSLASIERSPVRRTQASAAAPARTEVVLGHHTRTLMERLLSRVERVSSLEPSPQRSMPSPSPSAQQAAGAVRPAAVAMELLRPHSGSRAAGTSPPRSEPTPHEPAAREPARLPAPPVRLAEHQVERIAEQVLRTLDARSFAWRERMGRS